MARKTQKIIAILGPTSSGKSGFAIDLAKKFNGEVISVDSRQIYLDMDLGTGKVEGKWVNEGADPIIRAGTTKKNTRRYFLSEGIPHHLLDFVKPTDDYNVEKFKKDCYRKIEEVTKLGKLPILCGGTGFWAQAIVDDIEFPSVPPNKKLRVRLEKKSAEELLKQLEKLDPKRAKEIDQKNKFRLIRAIEICEVIGKVPKIKQKEKVIKNGIEYQFIQIGIKWPKEELSKKIENRLDDRWQEGMVDEVKKLKKKYNLSWEEIQSFGLAYFWIPLFLQNEISADELKQRVFMAERNYAKRQRTWFNKDRRIKWLEKGKNIDEFVDLML